MAQWLDEEGIEHNVIRAWEGKLAWWNVTACDTTIPQIQMVLVGEEIPENWPNKNQKCEKCEEHGRIDT